MQRYFRPENKDIREDMWQEVDGIVRVYRNKSGGITQVLREAQDVVGYLPVELIDYVAAGMNIPKSEAFGIASFYSLFSLKPKGRHIIRICTGTACYIKGVREILNRLEQVYELKDGETDSQGRFSLESVRCLGACGLAPVMVVDGMTYGSITPERVMNILEEHP